MPASTPCPDPPSLRRLLLGRLSDSDGEVLYEHLDECDRCAEYARTFRRDDWLSAALRGAAAGGDGGESESVEGLIDLLERRGPTPPDDGPMGQEPEGGGDHLATRPGDTTPPRSESAGAGRELFDFLAPAVKPDELGRPGEYRILSVLGVGGMGVVFHAEDSTLERAVALKAMLPGLAASASARRRFLREGRSAAALHHDNIVPIFQVGEDRGVPYIAMPMLRGETLEDRLRRETGLPAAEVFRIGREIAQGLAAAHAKGLIHRDIKPANIWLESDEPNREGIPMQGITSSIAPASSAYGRVKILDFGLARPTTDAKLTQEGAIVGTPAFMSPEQASGAAVDARSDLFSLGSVLYRAAAGTMPFQGDDGVTVLLSVARDHPRPPVEVNPGVPPPLSALVMRLLAKDPADRPASAREVIERLAQAEVESDAPPPPRKRRWGWRRWALLALALVLGGGAVAAMSVRVTVPTDRGDVTIETDDPNIEVVATKGGKLVRIVDPQSKQTWELDPQKYELRMADQPDGLVIELDGKAPFVLKRKSEKLVSITRGPAGKDEPSQGRLVRDTTWPGGAQHIYSAAFSPNGRYYSVAGQVGVELHVWETETGKPVTSVPGNEMAVFMPDNRHFLSPNPDKELVLWDLTDGTAVRRFSGHKDWINGVRISADGKRAVSSDSSGSFRLWDVDSGEQLREWQHPPGTGWPCLSRDGRRFLTIGTGEHPLRLWDAETGKAIRSWTVENGGEAFDGGAFVTVSREGNIERWDENSDAPTCLLKVGRTVSASGISTDGRRLVLGLGNEKAVHVYDLPEGREAGRIELPTAPCGALGVSADGRYGATAVPTCNTGGPARVYLFRLPDPAPPEEKVGELRQLQGHTQSAGSVAFAPGGRLAATGDGTGSDFNIRLWDVAEGREIGRFKGHTGPVSQVAFSQDGKRLASASFDRTIRLWDVETRQQLDCLQGHEDVVLGVAFSPDGRRLLSVGWHSRIRLWDTRSGEEIKQLGPKCDWQDVTFSPDGQTCAACGWGVVAVYDAMTAGGEEIRRFPLTKQRYCRVAFSANGRRLLGAGADDDGVSVPNTRVWEVETGRTIQTIPDVFGMAFLTSDGGRLLATEKDFSLGVWDVDDGKELQHLMGHTAAIRGVALTPDGRHALTAGADDTVRWWRLTDPPEPEKVGEVRRFSEGLDSHAWRRRVAFSADGRIVYAQTDGSPRVVSWVRNTGELRSASDTLAPGVAPFAMSPDRKLMLVPGDREGLQVVKPPVGEVVRLLQGATRPWCAAFNSAGDRVAVGDDLGKVLVWECLSGKLLWSRQVTPKASQTVAISPDGKTLVVWGGDVPTGGGPVVVVGVPAEKTPAAEDGDSDLVLCELDTGKEIRRLNHGPCLACAFSKDGKRLIAACEKDVAVWDPVAGKVVQRLGGQETPISAMALAPDEQHLATGAYDGSIRWWDIKTGTEVQCFHGHPGGVLDLAVSPDGEFLLSGGCDGTVRLWRLPDTPPEAVEVFRQRDGHVHSSVDLSPDGRLLVDGCWDQVRVWDVATGKLLHEFAGWLGHFTPDGKWIVTADKTVLIYDAESGQLLRRCGPALAGGFDSLQVLSDGKRAFTSSRDGTRRLWDLEAGKLLQTWANGQEPPAGAVDYWGYTYFCRGPRHATEGADGTVTIADRATEKEVARMPAEVRLQRLATISRDGRFAAACPWNERGDLVVWRLPDPAPEKTSEP